MVSFLLPQYSSTSPYRSQGTIYQNQYGTYSVSNRNNKRKGWNSSFTNEDNEINSSVISVKEYESKGYYLTIPQDQLSKMKPPTPLSPLQQRLKYNFSAGENISRGSLVDMVF